MCAQHTADSATYTSHPENCLSSRIGGSSPFSYPAERRTPSDCRTESPKFCHPFCTPNWLARDCAPAAQSKREKYLRRMRSSKRQINGDFERFVLMLCGTASGGIR